MCDNDDSEEPALLLSLVKKEQLQRVLAHVLDENKFLSPYGIKSLSKVVQSCLLYTSDAADDMQCVDLGGRRIIKK